MLGCIENCRRESEVHLQVAESQRFLRGLQLRRTGRQLRQVLRCQQRPLINLWRLVRCNFGPCFTSRRDTALRFSAQQSIDGHTQHGEQYKREDSTRVHCCDHILEVSPHPQPDLNGAAKTQCTLGNQFADRSAIASALFSSIQRLISGAQHLVSRESITGTRGGADTYRYVDLFFRLTSRLFLLSVFLSAISTAQLESAIFDGLSQLFQRRKGFIHRFARKSYGEFFTAVSE